MDFPTPKDPNVFQRLARILFDIRTKGLGGESYGSYKGVKVDKSPEDTKALAYLAKQDVTDVIGYLEAKDVTIFVYNRYRFERLLWFVYSATRYVELEKYADQVSPNIVVYDPAAGVGFINGNRLDFTRKQGKVNKKLFDALFLSGSDGVSEEKLKSIVGMPGRNGTAVSLAINGAFTNLRKICGVSRDVIQHKGSARLDALTFRPDHGLVKKLLQR